METLIAFITRFSTAFTIASVIAFIIAAVGQWRLYEKAGQPGYAIFVPVWNLIIFLKIVGRPASHAWFFLIPVFNIFFTLKVMLEVGKSFGKTGLTSSILIILFNVIYILNLGLAYDTEYQGTNPDSNEDQKHESKTNVRVRLA